MLQSNFAAVSRRYDSLRSHFDHVRLERPTTVEDKLRQWRILEGILSSAWQAWCGFSRSVLIKSCNGTTTRTGLNVAAPPAPIPEGRISYIAKCLANRSIIKDNKVIAPHQEPTWGDRQIVLDAARHLAVGNVGSLELGLLLITRAATDMRTVRNASAHLSRANLQEVQALAAYYHGSSLRHPTEMLLWTENQSGENCFHLWLTDLLDCAELMTE